MLVTTKSHLAQDHYVQQQEDLQGIGDIGKNFGEWHHQDQAKVDRCLGCVPNLATRETTPIAKHYLTHLTHLCHTLCQTKHFHK
jgi:hypothetical protein